MRIKIIEAETPKKAEYEINDFIEHCIQNVITIVDITSHVTVDTNDYYSYTFIVKYKK